MPLSVSLLKIDDTDARSLGEIKRRRTCCTLSIYFGVATTQMCRLSSAFENSGTVDAPFRKPFEIDGAGTRREHKLTAGVSLIR